MIAIDLETKSAHKVKSIDFEDWIVCLESSEYGHTRQDIDKVFLIREKHDPKISDLTKI